MNIEHCQFKNEIFSYLKRCRKLQMELVAFINKNNQICGTIVNIYNIQYTNYVNI